MDSKLFARIQTVLEAAEMAKFYRNEAAALRKENYDLRNHIAGLEALLADYEAKQSTVTVFEHWLERF